ncbi:hypothetical protein D3C87_1591150 [compost metagenome]
MHARRHFADQLQYQAVADHHRAVGLLRRQITHLRLGRQAQLAQLSGGFEANFATVRGQYGVVVHALQHGADEVFQTERIGDQTDLRPTANPGQCQLLGQCRPDLIFGNEAERQLIATGLAAAGDFDLAQQHRVLGIAKPHTIGQLDLIDCRVLAGEPATVLQPGRQNVLFQRVA